MKEILAYRFFIRKHIGVIEQIHFLNAQAVGTYIVLLNFADYWKSDKLQKQAKYSEGHPENGACFTQGAFADEHGCRLSKKDFELCERFMQTNRTKAQ